MESIREQDIKQDLRTNIKIFMGLLFLTLSIIVVRCVPIPPVVKLSMGLLLILIELALIIYYFIHLIAKKMVVCMLLILTMLFAFSILFWPAWDEAYSVRNSRDVKGI